MRRKSNLLAGRICWKVNGENIQKVKLQKVEIGNVKFQKVNIGKVEFPIGLGFRIRFRVTAQGIFK